VSTFDHLRHPLIQVHRTPATSFLINGEVETRHNGGVNLLEEIRLALSTWLRHIEDYGTVQDSSDDPDERVVGTADDLVGPDLEGTDVSQMELSRSGLRRWLAVNALLCDLGGEP
jgi:hypothetical protein